MVRFDTTAVAIPKEGGESGVTFGAGLRDQSVISRGATRSNCVKNPVSIAPRTSNRNVVSVSCRVLFFSPSSCLDAQGGMCPHCGRSAGIRSSSTQCRYRISHKSCQDHTPAKEATGSRGSPPSLLLERRFKIWAQRSSSCGTSQSPASSPRVVMPLTSLCFDNKGRA